VIQREKRSAISRFRLILSRTPQSRIADFVFGTHSAVALLGDCSFSRPWGIEYLAGLGATTPSMTDTAFD
jgi:hypothetical protein